LDRLRHAAARGILGAHVGHPFFMPMTPESYRVFWSEVSRTVPESCGLIHYNTPRCANYLHGIVGKAMAAASPFLMGSQRTRGPYLPVPDDVVEQFRRITVEQFPDLLWRP
jgi:hypothetical protein